MILLDDGGIATDWADTGRCTRCRQDEKECRHVSYWGETEFAGEPVYGHWSKWLCVDCCDEIGGQA